MGMSDEGEPKAVDLAGKLASVRICLGASFGGE